MACNAQSDLPFTSSHSLHRLQLLTRMMSWFLQYLPQRTAMVLFVHLLSSTCDLFLWPISTLDSSLTSQLVQLREMSQVMVCLSLNKGGLFPLQPFCSPFVQHNNDVVQFVIQVILLHNGAGVFFHSLDLTRSNLVDRTGKHGWDQVKVWILKGENSH